MSIYIHPTAVVDEGAIIGNNTKIWANSHIREGAVIGDNCNIGDCVYIDTGVVVGNNCRIQNASQLYNGVVLEDDVFIGPCVSTTNDLYPKANNPDFKPVPTLIKKGAAIGANATILCGITIGEDALIGCGSVVVNDVEPNNRILGNPASSEYRHENK